VIDKSQFAKAARNSTTRDEIAHASAAPTGELPAETPNNKDHTTDSLSSPILNQESLAALRQFFSLLDAWDREENRP